MEPITKKSNSYHLITSLFENNMSQLVKFLTYEDQQNLKLVNRTAYYNIITASLWGEIKMQIVAEKYEHIEDDLQLDNNEPQVKEEAQVKLLRNIRIHSLNKRVNNQTSVKKNRNSGNIKAQERFPSMYKNRIPPKTVTNMKFMKTQIGFKKISSSKNSSNYEYLLELPDKLDLFILESHGKQSMQLVLQRESLITDMINKWNEYQKKILQPMSVELTKQTQQVAFWKVREGLIKAYQTKFQTEKYQKLVNNISKIMILDDTIKKKLNTFLQNQTIINEYSKHIQPIKNLYQKIEVKMLKLQQYQMFKYWQQLEEILQIYNQQFKQHSQFLIKKTLNFIENIDTSIQFGLQNLDISIKKICIQSEQLELILEILLSIQTKLIHLLTVSESKFKQTLLLTKHNKYKSICSNLSKMAKYFSKVKLQLNQKQKQKKTGTSIKQISDFIEFYQNFETQYVIIDQKSIQKVDKQMAQFKKRIETLKNAVKKDKQ